MDNVGLSIGISSEAQEKHYWSQQEPTQPDHECKQYKIRNTAENPQSRESPHFLWFPGPTEIVEAVGGRLKKKKKGQSRKWAVAWQSQKKTEKHETYQVQRRSLENAVCLFRNEAMGNIKKDKKNLSFEVFHAKNIHYK